MKLLSNLKPVLQSGDEEDSGVRCWDCGEKFSDALTGAEKIGDFVVCSCGRRGSVLTGFVAPSLPGNFEAGIAALRKRTR